LTNSLAYYSASTRASFYLVGTYLHFGRYFQKKKGLLLFFSFMDHPRSRVAVR
jgi:hypothetical protein